MTLRRRGDTNNLSNDVPTTGNLENRVTLVGTSYTLTEEENLLRFKLRQLVGEYNIYKDLAQQLGSASGAFLDDDKEHDDEETFQMQKARLTTQLLATPRILTLLEKAYEEMKIKLQELLVQFKEHEFFSSLSKKLPLIYEATILGHTYPVTKKFKEWGNLAMYSGLVAREKMHFEPGMKVPGRWVQCECHEGGKHFCMQYNNKLKLAVLARNGFGVPYVVAKASPYRLQYEYARVYFDSRDWPDFRKNYAAIQVATREGLLRDYWNFCQRSGRKSSSNCEVP